jgi:hypothetical protein
VKAMIALYLGNETTTRLLGVWFYGQLILVISVEFIVFSFFSFVVLMLCIKAMQRLPL